ncbi:HIT family protein [mine drainage metagenome]|uniref:HIT family protein n=1 Tax=mine drainage metagenome TaxID=410659 RepID=T1C460_9ZZZZ
MSECVFCRLANHELPSRVVDEDDEFMAFHDLHPVAPVHVLVIPKHHVDSLTQWSAVAPVQAGRLLIKVRDLAALLGVAESGYRLVINTGPEGGQTVSHLHVHLLAGRSLQWPPG